MHLAGYFRDYSEGTNILICYIIEMCYCQWRENLSDNTDAGIFNAFNVFTVLNYMT